MTKSTITSGLAIALTLSAFFHFQQSTARSQSKQSTSIQRPTISVPSTKDFMVDGSGENPAWSNASWVDMQRRDNAGHDYTARFKVLYSKRGIYVLCNGSDQRLTANMKEDFMDLWTEDVFEVFLWPEESHPVYFEYEISPLNRELPIVIPNFDGKFLGWRPWHYEGDRKVQKATQVEGGSKTSGSAIRSWTAEFFIPFELLKPLQNVPPKAGTRWRANFYRVDYDDGKTTSWDWSRVGPSFHEFKKFGTLEFK